MYKKIARTISSDEFKSKLERKLIQIKSVFTEQEISKYYKNENLQSLIARYLIKEIVGELNGKLDYLNIEILNNSRGKPILNLSEEIKKCLENKKINNIQISLSHTKENIAAMLVYE
jgi:phosphopantetheine--protein transferase-like protein